MKPKSLFPILGFTGFVFAVIASAVLIYLKQLFWLPFIIMVITTILAFLILAFAEKIISGNENYVLYRQLLFSIVCVSFALSFLNTPILPYLDVYVCGFGVFHIFGRIGCYKAGCCHGRPFVFGNKYNESYRSQGFPGYLIDVVLFPVQIAEAIGIAIITLYCANLFFADSCVPGIVLAWYLIFYASLRFMLEFLRGDTDRPYFTTLSEAQWTSLFIMIFISAGSYFKFLPLSFMQICIALFFIITAVVVYLIKKINPSWNISNAVHLKELGSILNKLVPGNNGSPYVHTTSLGLILSLSVQEKDKYICSLSYIGKGKPSSFIKHSFRQIKLLKFRNKKVEMKKGNNGIHHYIIEV
jgi:prolipoprotein diacylglyceryltransferase